MGNWIDEHQNEVISCSKFIFGHPELALEETISAHHLAEFLQGAGFEIAWNLAGMPTAFSASWGNGAPVIGFLAEYDALPNLEQLPVATETGGGGNGHGCGHNLLGVGCAAAACALKDAMQQEQLPGKIMVFGCPGEEIMYGKIRMTKEGCFDGLSAAISWHPFAVNCVGEDMYQAMDSVKYRFRGKSAHAAAAPHLGRSALDAAELMNVGVNYLREHVPEDVRMHYIYLSAGEQPNIVPDFAETWYYIRAKSRQVVEDVAKRMDAIAQGATLMTETSVEKEVVTGCQATRLNSRMNEIFYEEATQIALPVYSLEELAFMQDINNSLGCQNQDFFDFTLRPLRRCPTYISGSSDVSEVSHTVPTVTISAACATKQTPIHHWSFTAQAGSSVGEKGMLYAAKIMAAGAYQLVRSPQLLDQIWKEHRLEEKRQ